MCISVPILSASEALGTQWREGVRAGVAGAPAAPPLRPALRGRPRDPVAIFFSGGHCGRRLPRPIAQAHARRAGDSPRRLLPRPGHHMARVLVAKMLACALSPLLRGSPGPAKPRALSTLLAGPLRTAGPAGPWPLPGRPLPGLQLALGFKTKGVIKERCRDCYRVKRRGRWFIYCKTNPKHKQRQM
ncbi:39S ribosomal protein L36, mitochondrial [Lynx rufus]|uniref:39S ribosomal protein L36, mitochondrial n=1 Tax=Lynx rufus TaxID=61384 RepID=UPI001F1289CC|nr:39S ribosomal protein L36, mitochondrial [Lynx rufus]